MNTVRAFRNADRFSTFFGAGRSLAMCRATGRIRDHVRSRSCGHRREVGIKKVELRNWSVVTEFSSIPGFPI